MKKSELYQKQKYVNLCKFPSISSISIQKYSNFLKNSPLNVTPLLTPPTLTNHTLLPPPIFLHSSPRLPCSRYLLSHHCRQPLSRDLLEAYPKPHPLSVRSVPQLLPGRLGTFTPCTQVSARA